MVCRARLSSGSGNLSAPLRVQITTLMRGRLSSAICESCSRLACKVSAAPAAVTRYGNRWCYEWALSLSLEQRTPVALALWTKTPAATSRCVPSVTPTCTYGLPRLYLGPVGQSVTLGGVLISSRYTLPTSVYLRTVSEIALVKTAWYSARFHGPVLVGRHSRIFVGRGARLKMKRGAVLAIGLAPLGYSRSQHRAASSLNSGNRRICATAARQSDRCQLAGRVDREGRDVLERRRSDRLRRAHQYRRRLRSRSRRRCHGHRLSSDHPLVWKPHKPRGYRDRCWLGHGAIVLKGVTLGEGCVVAAGAIVANSQESAQLLIGIPARSAGSVEWSMS